MRTVRTSVGRIGAVAFFFLLAVAGRTFAQTPEQLEIFRNLTPEQQQTVLQQMAPGTSSGPTSAATSATRKPGTGTVAEGERRGTTLAEDEDTKPAALKPQDSVLLQLELGVKDPDPEQRAKAQDLIKLIRSRNPYELDDNARLNLPGMAPVALGGLTEEQASKRLGAEPALGDLKLSVMRLPLLLTGTRGLKPFGYDLFDEIPSAFSPVTDAPCPPTT